MIVNNNLNINPSFVGGVKNKNYLKNEKKIYNYKNTFKELNQKNIKNVIQEYAKKISNFIIQFLDTL